MISLGILFLLLGSVAGYSQNILTDFHFGGSANDSIRGIAVDGAGNIYVTGTTFSPDLPLRNPFQSSNSGTQLIFSSDAGTTWKPLTSPFPTATPLQPLVLGVDPTDASTIYVGSVGTVCKSVDGGHQLKCAAFPSITFQTTVTSIVVDPSQPNTVYASATVNGGVFKSLDGGQTFTKTSTGLPTTGFVDSVVIDPFHPSVLYAWLGAGGFVSRDGAASWAPSTSPWPDGTSVSGGLHYTFDPVTSGVIYAPAFTNIAGPGFVTFQKSVDGGQTWKLVAAPFMRCCVVADPKTAGSLYVVAAASDTTEPTLFWKSLDGGSTWVSSAIPSAAIGQPVLDPANPQVILVGGFRSADGGKTWKPSTASGQIQPAFAKTGSEVVYATAPLTSDAFVAKFLPDGKTLVWATYFGGMGNEAAGSFALDASGNIWIAGSTSSNNLPVTAGAYQSSLNGPLSGFVAKFSTDGKLLASTYVGGSKQDVLLGIALSPQGNPWVIGSWTSADFPFTVTAPAAPQSSSGLVAQLDSSASRILTALPVDGLFDANGKGIAVDTSGNVTLTGSTFDAAFPSTVKPLPLKIANPVNSKAFVIKLDSSGNQIYATMFGGSQILTQSLGIEGERDFGVAVAVDPSGNAYIAGTTSAPDFPVTANSPQSTIAIGCPYPAFSVATGLIGTIFSYLVDDSFVVKLAPDGKTAVYSSVLGGSCYDRPTGIAVDDSGQVYIAGETDSQDYPLAVPVEQGPAVRQFASFVSVLDAAGSVLEFSTYLYAGSEPDITVAGNSVYLAGNIGPGAQTFPDSGAFNPFPATSTDAYLAVIQPPQTAPPVLLTRVLNGFSLANGPLAPGEIVTLTLPGFIPSKFTDAGLNLVVPLTSNLEGVQVTFDGRAASIVTVSAGQIVCIVPVEISGQSSTVVQVNVNGALSNLLTVPVSATALGLLSLDGSGTGFANARNADGTLNSASNPAAMGSFVTLYFTGAGLTSPAETDGVAPSDFGPQPVATITSPSRQGTVLPLPSFVPGIFSFTFTVPTIPNLTGNRYGVSLLTGTSTSQNLTIYIQ